jgi:hypothetical protein
MRPIVRRAGALLGVGDPSLASTLIDKLTGFERELAQAIRHDPEEAA